MRKSQAGDPDAFARLYDLTLDRVYRYVYFRVTDVHNAEDITSQVFLKAWENINQYRLGSSPFIAWLYRIARNMVIDQYRTTHDTSELDDEMPDVSGPAGDLGANFEQKVEADRLRRAMRQLTEEQQQVLSMKFFDGMSTQEIAKQMDRQQGAVRALQMRALQALAKALE